MLFEKRTCKEVAALVVAREDRTLSLAERAQLRTHMWICKACPGFENQILTMRNAMRQWRNYAGDTTAPAEPVNPDAPRLATRKDDIN